MSSSRLRAFSACNTDELTKGSTADRDLVSRKTGLKALISDGATLATDYVGTHADIVDQRLALGVACLAHIRPPRVLKTFGDALIFLLAVPAAEFSEYLQELGLLAVLFQLP